MSSGPSVTYDVQPRDPLEITCVACDDGSVVGACRCGDEQVHRGDGLSSAPELGEQGTVERREAVAGVNNLKCLEERGDPGALKLRIVRQLRSRIELTGHVYTDRQFLLGKAVEHGVGGAFLPSCCFAQQVNKEGSIKVGHNAGTLGESLLRSSITQSTASSVDSLRWISSRDRFRTRPVGPPEKCSLITTEKDCPSRLWRRNASYASISMVIVFTAMHIQCT